MKIEKFLNNFNDIITYKFQLKIGGNKANDIISNKELISYENRKGKIYPFYRKNLMGTTTDYVPLNKVNAPIELTIQCSHPHVLKWEKKSQSTNKKISNFEVRILNEDTDRQFGFLSLDLTPAGDIYHKFCSFSNEDRTHVIIQSINYNYDEKTKQVIPIECLSFIFNNLEAGLEEKVSFHKEKGILKCVTVNKQALKNHAFDSIIWSNENVKEKQEFFSRYCNNATVEKAILNCDITNFIINEDFTSRLERIKELQRLLTYEGKPTFSYDYDKIRQEIEYLKDPTNDIFSGFYGEYIGNTIIKFNSKLILLLETLKDDYHYFTSVDITNTNAFNVDMYFNRENGTSYYQAIKNSDKMPTFRIKIVNGEERLIPLGEHITNDELRNYEMFKSFCAESFNTIESEKMATLNLEKYSKKQTNELVKKITNIKSSKR